MDIYFLGIGAAALGIYALVSRRLSKSIISGPMFFAAVGFVAVAVGLGEEPAGDVTGVAQVALEMTLALVLFTDAMATKISSGRDEAELPSRLLVFGMPLIILAGAIVAAALFPEFDLVGVAIVATVLAPTDAALGAPVVSNTRVPARIRGALNIESGLNDGIALPFLLFFIAIGEAEDGANLFSLLFSAIGIAVIVGIGIGWVSARLIIASSDRGWLQPIWRQIAVVTVPVVAYVVADELGVHPADVEVVAELDTHTNAWTVSSGNYSSRFAGIGAAAVMKAGRVRRATAGKSAGRQRPIQGNG